MNSARPGWCSRFRSVPARTLRDFAAADQVVCVSAVSRFLAVGYHYADFSPTTDQEVIALLDAASRRGCSADCRPVPPDGDTDVEIPPAPPPCPGS